MGGSFLEAELQLKLALGELRGASPSCFIEITLW